MDMNNTQITSLSDDEVAEVLQSLGITPAPEAHASELETPDVISVAAESPLTSQSFLVDAGSLDVEENNTESTTEQEFIEESNTEISDIPLNSLSPLIDPTTTRFNSAPWFEKIKTQSITLAGLGGIGSWTALLLSRLKPAMIRMFDDDVIEAVNMAGQLYNNSNIGTHKVQAIASLINSFSDYKDCMVYPERYDTSTTPSNIMICGFDSMEARHIFFKSWSDMVETSQYKKECLFIDGRLAAEEFQIYSFTGDDNYSINKYKKECLFSDEEADDTPCSYKQTSYTAAMIASYIVNIYVNFATNLCYPVAIREIPFCTEYSADKMYLKILNN